MFLRMTTLCLVSIAACGCAPVIDAELGMIEQSRRGVSVVKDSVEQRRELVTTLLAKDRAALDEAFDADASQREQIDTAWLLEARQAYAAAVEALARRDASVEKSFDADVDNLSAIDDALIELDRLNRAQRQLFRFDK